MEARFGKILRIGQRPFLYDYTHRLEAFWSHFTYNQLDAYIIISFNLYIDN